MGTRVKKAGLKKSGLKKAGVKTLGAVAVVLASLVGPASAQERPSEAEVLRAGRIWTMEGILERAVSLGAENVLRQVANVITDRPSLSGYPEVRGFPLAGHGLFFYVQVPGLQLPVMWSMRHLLQGPDNRDTMVTVQELSRRIARLNGPEGESIRALVRQLEMQVGQQPAPAAGRGVSAAARVSGAAAPARPAVDPDVIQNPHAVYTREVKDALIRAMLEQGSTLALGADEWLTVAARDDEPRDPLRPGNAVDYSTWMIRVKGSDLAAIRSGTLSLEDARTRVEVSEN
jgi:hypothetical protein